MVSPQIGESIGVDQIALAPSDNAASAQITKPPILDKRLEYHQKNPYFPRSKTGSC